MARKVRIIRWEWPEKTMLWTIALLSAANLVVVITILLQGQGH